ncbi:glutamyl aminopeptidase [Tribolium castaneum]|uniref:glutamyl aminopeptidase n=1 Tax=Tribolium castaneum TaxID=7070 RepID=UPI0000D5716D|nr:PREDICTED: glutamyl aminopeptidase [Tribolium castaneum]|eukprot:XP_008198354.1 PREDICTED: glutamyl aminopeptidase [Tribolium castaneum]
MNFALVLFVIFLSKVDSWRWYPSKYRLSGQVRPLFYSIKIRPNLDERIFSGEVQIHVRVETTLEFLDFHAADLTIQSITFDGRNVANCWCNRGQKWVYGFEPNDLIRIFGVVPPGNHLIRVRYSGNFASDNSHGLFLAGFGDNNTVSNHLLGTDFEPTFARKVFPCLDEPGLKAPIKLGVVVPNRTFNAISNMPVMKIEETKDGVLYKFQTTPPMSTYLLSFVVSKHSYKEFYNKIPYRIYSSDIESDNKTYLLEFASQVIDFYTKYTNQSYTLPKIDLVEFEREDSTATENWGLITLKPGLLSSKEDVFDNPQKYAVIAHELAHFWFGNLVTNKWWNDIWLQEGFATFMSIKAEEKILNNSAELLFSSTYLEEVFWAEASNKTTPIVNYEEFPDNIKKNFNDVTYNKGAAVLRMLEMVLGEDFRAGVVKYIKDFAFKTATTNDFLAIFDQVRPGLDLRDFLESYLYQTGYPLISVENRQDRYVLTQRNLGHCTENLKWTIPLTYITDSDRNATLVWLDRDVEKLEILKKDESWIKFNHQQIGYYRVKYSPDLWNNLLNHTEELEDFERDHLLLEATSLFDLNVISCEIPLKFLQKLAPIGDFNTDNAFIVYLKLAKIRKVDETAFEKLKELFQEVLEQAGKKHKMRSFDENLLENEEDVERTKQLQDCVEWLKSPQV